jgi:type I restriction enzyme S subunit
MDVRPAYRRTEFGEFPSDWDFLPMGNLFTFQNGVNAEKAAYGSGVPFINILEVITHSTITENNIPGKVTLSARAIDAFEVRRGDILFNRTSETQAEVGLASVYAGQDLVVFGGFVIRARPRDARMDSRFTSYALRSPAVRIQIVARGQGAVRANIGQQDLSRVQVYVPTKVEQEAIAEALSDADALIGAEWRRACPGRS